MTYTDLEIHQIKTLRRDKVSWDTIGRILGKKPGALRQWWHKNSHLVDLPPAPKISKSKTNSRIGLQIKKIVTDNPRIPFRDIPAELAKVVSNQEAIPQKTVIHKYLQENGMKTIRLLQKPLICARNIQKRVDFASEYMPELELLKMRTIWSDETTVRQRPNSQQLLWKCHSSVDKEDLPHNHQIQAGGFSVMFWGCFSAYGTGPLVALEGNQDQYSYRQTLRKHLLPEIRLARRDYGIDMTFMQDNAPCHKTDLIRDFLHQHGIPTLDWPPQSPDMNPIENLWHIVKKRRQKKYGIPRTQDELIEQVFDIWSNLEFSLLIKLVDSIENRLKEVLRLKGRATKY
jgi:transposase